MMAYCGHIIEHSPVLGDRAARQYHAAYDKHVARMKKVEGERLDSLFWPSPKGMDTKHFEEEHDGDSDDCCSFPYWGNCG
jgi:hypothetical protein